MYLYFCIKKIIKFLLPHGLYHHINNYRVERRSRTNCVINIIKMLNGQKKGFYVELGANDGIRQSNTYLLERNYGWKGILIEPALNNFISCKRNRARNNFYACCACVPFTFKNKFVELSYSDLMTTGSTSYRDHKHNTKKKGRKYCDVRDDIDDIEFCARAETLTEILNKAKSPKKIDLLSLDVEGAELGVLQGIDFDLYSFKYMVIECHSKIYLKKIVSYLKPFGYILTKNITKHDYVFMCNY